MGWFWADTTTPPAAASSAPGCPVKKPASHPATGTPPAGCPMHKATVDAFSSAAPAAPAAGCPVQHDAAAAASAAEPQGLSRLNPLNYMFRDLSQARAPNQTVALPTEREASTIPKGDGAGTWEYPSPQQMYHALLRKGYTDTDATAVESMVAVHNFLNEGAWAEIVDWERRFGRGLARGWQISRRGEANAPAVTSLLEQRDGGAVPEPRLIRFQGRPGEMTPKAAFLQLLGRLYPAKFGTEPPFDRHDWFVARAVGDGRETQVRYVIDYYAGPPEPTGEPVFYLDVRPALTPAGAAERLLRWGGDVWWRASGGEARQPSV